MSIWPKHVDTDRTFVLSTEAEPSIFAYMRSSYLRARRPWLWDATWRLMLALPVLVVVNIALVVFVATTYAGQPQPLRVEPANSTAPAPVCPGEAISYEARLDVPGTQVVQKYVALLARPGADLATNVVSAQAEGDPVLLQHDADVRGVYRVPALKEGPYTLAVMWSAAEEQPAVLWLQFVVGPCGQEE